MLNDQPQSTQAEWDHVLSLWGDFLTARNKLVLNHSEEVQSLINQSLKPRSAGHPNSIHFALDLIKVLPLASKKDFLAPLLGFCSDGKYAEKARETILSFPNNWLLENIESKAEHVLDNDDFLDWVNILSVFAQINTNLGMRLANRMLSHSDPDLVEWGEEFIEDNRLN